MLRSPIPATLIAALLLSGSTLMPAAESPLSPALPFFKQNCLTCHGKAAMAGLNIEKLLTEPSVADSFQHWQRIATVLDERRMPPPKMPQPAEAARAATSTLVRTKLNEYAVAHAGDPGRVTVRRLTSAEYAYAVRDLTGIDTKTDRDFANDSVGGEGFTNFGDVQFMQDANLETYLASAKRVASHAVIGSGPLHFFADPGKSGFEISAITRIQDIYHANGFRSSSGEGGKAYGLALYGKVFYATWRFQHRAAFGETKLTLDQIAKREGVSPTFARHVWQVLQQPAPTYPTSEAVTLWKKIPAPLNGKEATNVRAHCEKIQAYVVDWPRFLFGAGAAAAGGAGDERSFVLSEDSLKASTKQKLTFNTRLNLQGPMASAKTVRFYLSAPSLNPSAKGDVAVIWRNPTVRFRKGDRGIQPPQPLISALDPATVERLKFGKHPNGSALAPDEFATLAGSTETIELTYPEGIVNATILVDAEIDPAASNEAVIRATISDSNKPFDGRPVSAILGFPKTPGFDTWKQNVLAFNSNLPSSSHGEPTPADKDPIPAPYNNVYNQPERDSFHINVKYYRDDRFLAEKMLDAPTRTKLDQAWNDLLASFEYHDLYLRFVADKFKLKLSKPNIEEIPLAEIAALPAEPRKYVQALRTEYDRVQAAQAAAHPGHIEDALQFAASAWRKPLTPAEKDTLRAFYTKSREINKLDHVAAMRATIARILVAPAFLYRLETQNEQQTLKSLASHELASRLSFFLWSSVPDAELLRAARANELATAPQVSKQVQRMLADPKSRRFATEFFGQWLGFYRFDQYTGVDSTRYPEFTADIKSGMYEESVAFFEHILRQNRPLKEMLSADYTFLTPALAKFYGVKYDFPAGTTIAKVDNASAFNRGGMLRLGSVLTATSAPLRTSPVKRGDWVLRRILGTPTPPPPADAGSIPADDKAFGGMTVFERLESHKRNATCAACHNRIDPLGFPLEHFDAVGRWRSTYNDGKPIRDNATSHDKAEISGVNGLTQYLQANEQQVIRTLTKKLLGYALGRTTILSDEPLIERLTKSGGDTTFASLITEIANSKQFRFRREELSQQQENKQPTRIAAIRK
jgi:hypothetical protein